jgi:hypothetical protein
VHYLKSSDYELDPSLAVNSRNVVRAVEQSSPAQGVLNATTADSGADVSDRTPY